jgi:hypothetical protein
MAIHYIANDPFAVASAPKIRKQAKRPNRPAGRAGFTFSNPEPQGTYDPGTPGFLYWQCRESALAAVEAWEAVAGTLTAWQGHRKRLALLQDDGVELNAYYDRHSFSFFHRPVGTRTFFSGASTDVVAHEVGHGLLDAIRPDLWAAAFLEVAAFHEAFGDCVAILTALNDRETRKNLLGVTRTLKKRNFVETTIELLAAGIKAIQPTHNAAEPRHAYNTLAHQIPETLPDNGGPGDLINEVHSFGMVFTACFYDVVVGIFAAGTSKTEAGLLAAARKAGTLLVGAASKAVVTPRFFQSVGRAMILADDQATGGANRQIIRKAFERHNIMLGANALLGATAVLSGGAPKGKGGTLSRTTKKDLAARLGVSPGARFSVEALDLSGQHLTQVVHTKRVSLGSVHKSLKGVAIEAPVPVVLGASGGKAAVMGDIPEPVSTEREVHAFAQSLLRHGQIEFTTSKSASTAAVGAATAIAKAAAEVPRETHRVIQSGGGKMLVRVRFSCGCRR